MAGFWQVLNDLLDRITKLRKADREKAMRNNCQKNIERVEANRKEARKKQEQQVKNASAKK